MAKASKTKNKSASAHSRAARRAESPPDRTLMDMNHGSSETRPLKQFPVHHYGGVAKKKTRTKPLSRAQRLRRQKGMERAEVVLDQLEVKKSQSLGRGKKINARRATWDDHNSKMPPSKQPAHPAQIDEEEWEDADDSRADAQGEEEERQVIEGVQALNVGTTTGLMAESIDGIKTIGVGLEDDDEIL